MPTRVTGRMSNVRAEDCIMAASATGCQQPGRAHALRVLALLAGLALLVIGAPMVFPGSPAQSYPAFAGLVACAALWFGRSGAFWVLGACIVLMVRFLVPGEGFSVTSLVEALGLVVFTSVGIFLAMAIGPLRARLHATEAVFAAAQAERDGRATLHAEITHRVANDLGAIAAMARIQSNAAPSEDARTALQGIAARIDVFKSLYRRLNVHPQASGTIEMGAFLDALCDGLRAAHLGQRPVALELAAKPCRMAPARAAKIGLVLNEAVVNALKYAFPDGRPGRIVVAFGPDPAAPAGFQLTVSDDGIGPVGSAPRGSGLGQKLLTGMASQLRGSYGLERTGDRTVARLRIGP